MVVCQSACGSAGITANILLPYKTFVLSMLILLSLPIIFAIRKEINRLKRL